MIYTPSVQHEATDKLCRDIAKKSHGVCFFGFSGGKDSLCAWLQLNKYFTRVIPFFCTSYTTLPSQERLLRYYEYEFQTRILRLVGEDLPINLRKYIYQYEHECNAIDQCIGGSDAYSKIDIVHWLRYMYNLPNAWVAYGIQASDSIDRRIYCNRTGGKSEENKSFYPCWDWTRKEIVDTLQESGMKLNPQYRYLSRTMGGVPSATNNRIMLMHFPEDYKQVRLFYPLCEAKNMREDMLDREWAKAKARQMAENDAQLSGQKEASETPQEQQQEQQKQTVYYELDDNEEQEQEAT